MDWTVSSYPKDTIYTHEWTIEDFLKAMYRNDGKIVLLSRCQDLEIGNSSSVLLSQNVIKE